MSKLIGKITTAAIWAASGFVGGLVLTSLYFIVMKRTSFTETFKSQEAMTGGAILAIIGIVVAIFKRG